jgi:hypothetical protein
MPNTHKPRVPIRGEVLGSKPVCATSKCCDRGRLGLQVVELFQQAFDIFVHAMPIAARSCIKSCDFSFLTLMMSVMYAP